MHNIVWAPPPAAQRGRFTGWRPAIVEELKQRPHTWALVEAGVRSSSAAAQWRRHGCESTCRTVRASDGSKRYDVYARWTGRTA